MVAMPWYLLSAGIVLILIGAVLAAVNQPSQSSHQLLNSRLSDDEIARSLQSGQESLWPRLIILLGIACVGISLAWRILRFLF